MQDVTLWDYDGLRSLVRGQRLPLVLVDLDRFDANCAYFAELARAKGKTVRIASKSLRVPALLQRAFNRIDAFRGVMCYSAAEAASLAQLGFDDFLLGYPTVQDADLVHLAEVLRQKRVITCIVDCPQHVERLAAGWEKLGLTDPLRICIDVDVSWRPFGLHIGAQRSPVRSIADLERLLDAIAASPHVKLVGLMTYEAHLAGVPDASPFAPLQSRLVQVMKHFARRDVKRQREQIKICLERRGLELQLINGGGTGSFEDAIGDPLPTEVTVGSGLLQSHLFDYYRGRGQPTIRPPAICVALPITRIPQADRVTCQSVAYVATGQPGADRLPLPFLPEGLQLDPREGFGEVQTPLIVPPHLRGKLGIGDPIFFRPAKAGEIAEHFNEYLLVHDGRIVDRARTYRGLNQCF